MCDDGEVLIMMYGDRVDALQNVVRWLSARPVKGVGNIAWHSLQTRVAPAALRARLEGEGPSSTLAETVGDGPGHSRVVARGCATRYH